MAVGFRGAYNSGGAANPSGTAACTWELSGTNAQAGDLAICILYSRASTKTFTNIAGPTLISGQDVSNATYGHLWVGACTITAQMITDGHVGHADLNSVSNGTTGWITAVLSSHNGVRAGATPATGAAATNPDPPALSTTLGDALLAIFGQMDQNDGISAPTNFTSDAAAAWSTTLGTDGACGLAYDLDGGTGSSVNPGAFTATTKGAWYATTIAVRGDVPQTATPTGVASAQAIGTPSVIMQHQAKVVTGIASAQAIGTPVVKYNRTFTMTGIASAQAIGTPSLETPGAVGFGAVWAQTNADNGNSNGWTGLGVDSDGSVILAAYGGSYGRVWHTIDGGTNWHEEYPYGSAYDYPWGGCDVDDDGSVMLCGYWYPYHTANSGSSWHAETPYYYFTNYAIDSDGSVMLIGGSSCITQLTTNSGSTWAALPSPAGIGTAEQVVACDGDGSVIVVAGTGSSGIMYHSTDSGASFHQESPQGTNPGYWRDVAISDDGQTIVAATWTAIYITTDGGANWSKATSVAGRSDFYSVAVSGGGTRIAAGFNGGIAMSDDSGSTWGPLQMPGASGQNYYVNGNLKWSGDGNRIVAAAYNYKLWLGHPTKIIKPSGVVGAQAVGTVAVEGGDSGATKVVSGVASAEAVGAPVVRFAQTAAPSGVASAEAVGTAARSASFTRTASGVASGESLGSAARSATLTRSVNAVSGAEAIGAPTTLKGSVTRTLLGVASAEALGSVTVTRVNLVSNAGGIASAEAVGAVKWHLVRLVSGVASAETIGAAGRSAPITRTAAGVASAETIGAATRSASRSASPFGIASAEAVGSVAHTASITRTASGVASAEATGAVTTVKGGVSRTASGVATSEAVGSVTVASGLTRSNVGGLASAETIGTPKVHVAVPVVGIASAEQVGVAARTATISRTPSGIASQESTGDPQTSVSELLLRTPNGVASQESVGSAARQASVTRTADGVYGAEAIGSAARAPDGVTRTLTGVAGAEAVGNAVAEPVSGDAQSRAPGGVAGAEAIGSPSTLKGSVTRAPGGVASAEACGSAARTPNVTPSIAGVASGEFTGTPSTWKANRITPTGVASAQAIGSATRLPGPVVRSASGVLSAEAVGTATINAGILVTATGLQGAEEIGASLVLAGVVNITPVSVSGAERIGSAGPWLGRVFNNVDFIITVCANRWRVSVTPQSNRVRARIERPAWVATTRRPL